MARFISIKGLIINTKDIQVIHKSDDDRSIKIKTNTDKIYSVYCDSIEDREITICNIINYLNVRVF